MSAIENLIVALASRGKRRAVIFDIDGTLASEKHRSDDAGPWGPRLFRSNMDPLIPHTFRRLKEHRKRGEKVILVTARTEVWRDTTERWLRGQGIVFDELYMRPDDNAQTSQDLKRDLYHEVIAPRYDVTAAYDDSLSNLSMWTDLGIESRPVTDPGGAPLLGIEIPRADPEAISPAPHFLLKTPAHPRRPSNPLVHVRAHPRVRNGKPEWVDSYTYVKNSAIAGLRRKLSR